MSFVAPSTLSSSDISLIESLYSDPAALYNDLNSGTLPSEISPEDALAYLYAYTDTASFDPDDPSLSEIWTQYDSDGMQDMLTEVYDDNRSDTEMAWLIADMEAYLEAAGEETDLMSSAERIIQDYTNLYGEPGNETSGETLSDDMLTSLLAFFKRTNFYMYLLLDFNNRYGPAGAEGQGIIADQLEEVVDEREDVMDDIEGMHVDDDNFQVEMTLKNTELENLKSKEKILEEVMDTINEDLASRLEMIKNGLDRQWRTTQAIIQ